VMYYFIYILSVIVKISENEKEITDLNCPYFRLIRMSPCY
jgi:hypothetical protein